MNPKSSFSLCLLCCLAALMIGCTFVRTGKSAKRAEPAKQAETSKVEWGERKWETYAKDEGGVSYFFDKGSIAYPSKGLIHVWRKRVFPQERLNMKEIVALDEINCRTQKYRSLELQAVNRDGSVTEVFNKPSPWTPIYLDTADEYFLDNFCKEAAKAQ